MTGGEQAAERAMDRAPVDRTEELIRAMLGRRADRPVPDSLLARTVDAVLSTPQARGRNGRRSVRSGSRTAGRGTWIAIQAVLVLGIAGLGLLAVGLLRAPGPSVDPGVAVGPSPTAEPAGTPGPSGGGATPPMTGGSPGPQMLQPESVAIVTSAGTNLRVRAAPSTRAARIESLPTGTRLYVLSGPVEADGLSWYEVLTDGKTEREGIPIRKYGWVAAGSGGETWIEPAPARCWDYALNASTLAELSRVDLLACYHDAAVTIRGTWKELKPGESGIDPCVWDEAKPACSLQQGWLLYPMARITYRTDDGASHEVDVAVPDDLRDRLEAVPHKATLTATIAMDVPEARSCSVGDPANGPLPRAVAACRVRYALRDVSWNDGTVKADSIAQVAVSRLTVRKTPSADGEVAGRVLHEGDRVYVAEGPQKVDGTDWYAVRWEDQDSVYGWVPATLKGHPTLSPRTIACAGMADWSTFFALDRWERLACFGDRVVSVDMWVGMGAPSPQTSFACLDWKRKATSSAPGQPPPSQVACLAEPTWISGVSGLWGRRRGDSEVLLTFDPATVDVSALRAGYTWLRVTGSYANPASDQCRVTDQASGTELMPPGEAKLECEAAFVVTKLEPAKGPVPE